MIGNQYNVLIFSVLSNFFYNALRVFEHIFEIDLGQYRRTFLEIKARKNDRTKFITTLNEKLLTRMNNSDEVL